MELLNVLKQTTNMVKWLLNTYFPHKLSNPKY